MFNKMKKIVTIEGMMCDHCKTKVEKSLSQIENVCKVKVNLKDKTAIIYYNNNINEEEIKNNIAKLDYKVINIGEGK